MGSSRTSDTDEGISSDSEPAVSVQSLIQTLRKKEQRILQLEVDIVKVRLSRLLHYICSFTSEVLCRFYAPLRMYHNVV